MDPTEKFCIVGEIAVALRKRDGATCVRAEHRKGGVKVYVHFDGDKPGEECPELQAYGEALVRSLPLPVGYRYAGIREMSGYRSMIDV